MKKEILMLAVLTMSAACTEISVPNKVDSGEYRTLYFTSEKPVSGDETKTYYGGDKNILWGPGEERIAVVMSNSAVTVEDKISGNVPQRVWGNDGLYSNPAEISDGGKTATFSLTENDYCKFPTSSGTYRFHAIYPTQAAFTFSNVSYWDWGVFVGTREDGCGQYPSTDTFDPLADVMLGISRDPYTSFSGSEDALMTQTIPMIFDRLVTHVKISLTDIPDNVTNITKAIITGPKGCTMSGIYYINVLKKELGSSPSTGETKAAYNYVILNYGSSKGEEIIPGDEEKTQAPSGVEISGNTFDLWFCSQPIEITSGQPLTISLYNEVGCLSRQITARAGGIKFEKNKLSTLTVSMKTGEYSTYTYELLDSEMKIVDKLELPRTSGVTEFYVRTNAGNSVSFSYDNLPNIISISEVYGSSYIDDKGWNVIKCRAVHKENHSLKNIISGSIDINFRFYGSYSQSYQNTFSISQNAGAGDVVIGDWTGDYVEMAGLLWYPCNLGFDLDHPFGKYYQWGRKDGQYPYFEDNTVIFATPSFDEAGKITEVDTNTYYYNNGNWFRNDNTTADFAWPKEDNVPYLGMGNPCPNGWRLPTSDEWEALNKLFNKYSDIKHTDKLHGIASFEGKTSTGMAAVWEACDNNTGASLEFSMSGYLAVQNNTDFTTNVNNRFMCRFGTSDLKGYYWASDILSSDNSSGYSYNEFSAYYTEDNCNELKPSSYQWVPWVSRDDGYSYSGRSVRCVKSIAAE